MWTVVLITCDKPTVDKLKQKFHEHSVMMRIKTVRSEESGAENCYEVMVPYAEISIAQDIIIEEEIN